MRSPAASEAEAVEDTLEAANAVAGLCGDGNAQVCAKVHNPPIPGWALPARMCPLV